MASISCSTRSIGEHEDEAPEVEDPRGPEPYIDIRGSPGGGEGGEGGGAGTCIG